MKAFMYHYVRNDSTQSPFSAHKTIENFVSEINTLLASGFVFGNPSQLLTPDYFDLQELQQKSIILTFDDGLRDHLGVARILQSLGVGGAIFYIPVEPYLSGNVLAVHKAQFIRSKFGPESLTLLEEAARYLNIDLISHYTIKADSEKFQHAYCDQIDDLRTKEFKRLINYYGDLGLRESLLDKILELSGVHLGFQDVYLLETEIVEIMSMGFEIGSHGLSHTPLSRLDSGLQKAELRDSKVFLENLTGAEILSFCYPYGGKESYDPSTLNLLRRYGYYNAVSVEYRDIATEDILKSPYEIPRYDCNMISEIFKLPVPSLLEEY